MKKIFIFILLLVTCFTSSFGLVMEVNQEDNYVDFYSLKSGNSQIQTFVGNINQVIPIDNSSQNYTYDISYEFSGINEEFYLSYTNYYANTTLSIHYRGDLTRNPTLYSQEMTMLEEGVYLFKFSPSYTDEVGRVYIDIEDTSIGIIEYTEKNSEGFNYLMLGFVNSFLDIVQININMWRILFYTIILVILISFVLLLFGGSWWIFKSIQRIKSEKGLFGGRDNE